MFEREIPDLTDSVKTILPWCMRHDGLGKRNEEILFCSFKCVLFSKSDITFQLLINELWGC